jgi:cell wall-associated NlpC family hydrolase
MAAAGLMTLATGFLPQVAKADSLSDLRAQAAQIAQRINSLGVQEETLSEQYDGALIHQKAMITKVAQARADVAKADSDSKKAAEALQQEAVTAYVDNGSSGSSTNSIKSADDTLLQAEYEQSVASSQADAEDKYKLASETTATAEANLKQSEQAAANTVAEIKTDKNNINSTITQLTSEESQAKGQIANLVYQDRMAAQRAAAAAYQRKLAAERAAATTTTSPATTPSTQGNSGGGGGGSGTTPTTTVTTGGGGSSSGGGGGGSSIGEGAVQAALTRVGDPYVWGAAGPNAFDCSGLVMWSYAQVGVSLPHFSGAQYADGTQISMDDLEPGDLVFPPDPGEHVAMYIGGGNIVQAPYTGADVQVIPLSSFFTLAVSIS